MTEIVNNKIITAQGRELVTLMDDYGTESHVYILVTDPANRQRYIDAATATLDSNQTAMEAYAKTHNIDLTAQKAAGAAKKLAAKAKLG
jgi:hypothetical protein